MVTIISRETFCDYEDEIMVTAFGQEDNYFMIQRDDEEASNLYIELDDQGQGCYEGLDKIVIENGDFIFLLNEKGREYLGTDNIRIVGLSIDDSVRKKVVKEVTTINMILKNNNT